jgi:hypothetical protein
MLTMGFGLGYFHRKGQKLFVKGWMREELVSGRDTTRDQYKENIKKPDLEAVYPKKNKVLVFTDLGHSIGTPGRVI